MDGISGESMKVKTEWAANPSARREADERPSGAQSGIGRQLNEMSGITKAEDPYQTTKKKELDKEAFLKMFMTQLKYQDPTSPVDNEKMAQQMAMFSQLEQSVTTNQYLEKILAKSGDSSEMAFGLIGKTVTADKASLFHNKLENTAFDVKLPQDASELKVTILNEAGEPVKELDFAQRPEGNFQIRWDGKTSDGMNADSGRYFYKVEAKGIDGSAFTIEDKVEGKVTGISKANGETFLLIGDRKISMNEVNTVKSPEPEAPKDGAVDNKMAGTKSETEGTGKEIAKNTSDSGKGPSVELSDSVKEALGGSAIESDPRLNSLMPLFMR